MRRSQTEEKYLAAFGKNVAKVRRAQGLTQEQLASHVGLSRETIGQIERGKKWTRISTLHQIAEALNITTYDELLKNSRRKTD